MHAGHRFAKNIIKKLLILFWNQLIKYRFTRITKKQGSNQNNCFFTTNLVFMRKTLLLSGMLSIMVSCVFSQTSTTINASTNYIVPAGVTSITIQAWGAGGYLPNNKNGAGGGAFVQSTAIPVTPGQSISVFIGNGLNTNTIFGSFITAYGGSGQTGGIASSGGFVQTSYKGGNGGTGVTVVFNDYGGGGGGAGGSNGAGQNGQDATNNVFSGTPGNGGGPGSGGGAGGRGGSGGLGQGGGLPGGGKGGVGNNASGTGRVIVTYNCTSANVPKVLGNSVIIADGDGTPATTDHTDFGDVTYYGSSLIRTFTIQNTGTMPVRIQSIGAAGTDAGMFTVQGGSLPRYVSPGTSSSFQVTFTPQGAGVKTAGISILMDNCNLANYDFAIKGTGICLPGSSPLVKFNETTINDGDVSPSFPDSTDFGDIGFNGYNTTRTYRIHNAGTAPLRVNSLSLTGTDPAQFSLPALSFPVYLAAGALLNIPVKFTPTTAGVKNAILNIGLDNCAAFNYDFAIKGTGICNPAGNIGVTGNNLLIADGDITPSTADSTAFGNVGFNGFFREEPFVIKNPSPKTLQVTGITLTGTHAAMFTVQSFTSPRSIPAGDSAIFILRFAPTSTGAKTATVNIASDNCGIANFDFAVSGTGFCDPIGNPAVISQNQVLIADGDNTPSTADLTDYGEVGTGGFSQIRNFTISNPSGIALVISSIGITGPNAASFSVKNIALPANIPAGGKATFSVLLIPKTLGALTATVGIAMNNCNITTYDFALKGNGISPKTTNFSANGNFTPLPGITSVIVQAWGAGGNASGFDGGGGGAYVLSNPITVVQGTNYPVSIGQANGSPASNTSFGNFFTANGGNLKTGGTATTGSNIAFSYKGGNGGTGYTSFVFDFGAGGGGAGGSTGAGSNGDNATSVDWGYGGTPGSGGGKGGNGGYDRGLDERAGSAGATPGGGGGGGKPAAKGANGLVSVSYSCPGAGTIGTSHSVPYPPQLVPDSILSFEGEAPTTANGLIYSWQQSTDTSNAANWKPAKTPTNKLSYRLDRDSIKVKTYYRRVSNTCGVTSYSNVVAINVIPSPNGAISGIVRSKNGAPVKGIKIYAQKVSALPGSPATWIDSAETGIDGQYTISKIYYGDPNEGNNNGSVETSFIVTPYKLNHGFKPGSLPKKLSNNIPQISSVDFTDTTVYAISGKIYQECVGCLDGSDVETTISAPLDSVEMYKDNSFITKSGFIDPPGVYGRYSVTVTDPETYKIEPKFKNHTFSPAFNNVLVENNVDNVDFKDVTTYTISGKLTAGCGDYIGTATLEFTDMLPNDKDGNPRASMFRKRVTTNPGSGTYSITLPARKWQVKVLLFSPVGGGDVASPDLLNFFEVKVPKDSLIRDITTGNATLNLVYNRPPTLDIVGLDPVCTLPEPFALFEQSKEKTFTVKAYQGPAGKNCPATDTSLFVNTNIQKDDINEVIELKTVNGSAQVKLTGGIPNIVAPHFKVLNLVYTDANGFSTQLNRNVVVTGLKSNIGSFATVSPEVPLMVLHDPPGDNSFSFWETSKTNETATRFYAASGVEASAWAEVKLGTEFSAGLGVTVETSIWGSIKGSVGVSSRTNNATEAIISTTTTQNFSTASNDAVVGSQGDVFIGAALNLLYALTNEVAFNAGTCSLSLNKKLMIAQNGFATQYIYSEDHIRNTLLPTLRTFVENPLNTPEQTKNYQNQVKVWEQTLANNDANKKKAVFDKNISFDGSAGPITSTTTTTSTKSNTIEFDLNINAGLAIELGFEIGGSGASGGVDVAFKMETGNSKTNTVMNSTTIGYTLDDDDNGDFYSVNIKKDPVYNTPVFELVAGTTSCPYEPGSQPRDEMQLIVPQPVKTDVDPNGEAEFILKLSNTSQSGERRSYSLSFVQASNPNGAVVTIGGSPAVNPITYSIDYLGEVNILVKVKRGASNIFSYEGLQFRVSDACDGSIEKTARISAFFTATCSPIILTDPAPGWITNQADNNVLPILFKGYSVANTTSVTLEYQKSGANNWITGFTRQAVELNNSPNGTLVNWNVTGLNDGAYNLRMKLNCPAGVVNSERSAGIIDRISPVALGKPEPTDDEFKQGDQISLAYNEPLDCGGVTPSDVQVRRLSDNALIDANVGCFQNKIVVVPITDISTFVGDSIRVSVTNISDLNGNGKTTTDSWRFIIGNTVPATGPRALTLSSTGTPGGIIGGKALLSGASVNEDAGIPIKFVFELPANAANDMLINYTVSGNGVYQKDYNIDYSQNQNLATVFNGASGSLTLKKGTKKVELSIIPIPNQQFEPDKTITITLAEGGDYELGALVTATGTILNDDSPKVYVFNGSGNFNVPANWDNNIVPPSQILIGDEVIIDPPNGGECILNVPVTVMPGAKFTVMPGKVLRIENALQLKKKL